MHDDDVKFIGSSQQIRVTFALDPPLLAVLQQLAGQLSAADAHALSNLLQTSRVLLQRAQAISTVPPPIKPKE